MRLVRGSSEPPTLHDSIETTSQSLNFQETMMLTDLLHYLPDDILTKVDRASMASGSGGACVPMLDHRVVEFAWQFCRSPSKFAKERESGILREVLAKFLPRELMDRPKMGFAIPLDRWLRGPLRDWAEDLLSPANLSELRPAERRSRPPEMARASTRRSQLERCTLERFGFPGLDG